MSANTYSRMSADALIEEFVRVGQLTPTVWTVAPILLERTPERLAGLKEIQAIGAELRLRKPIEKLRPLYDHENNDVRAFAAFQFMSIDEDWALATLSAINERLSTQEVMALCARAKRRPPSRPSLKEMSTERLARRFEDAGVRKYATRFLGKGFEPCDVKLGNRIVGEMSEIARELKSRDALNALASLMEHPNIAVRCAAAIRCLAVAPEQAIPVLEAIKAGRDVEQDSASWALYRRREGQKGAATP
ncbi:MAG: DUF2019 domain-containing protein [Roseiarcus sp.]